MKLAKGAEPILAARMKGKRPADMVLVALEVPPSSLNPFVVANPTQAYDWRWVRGLDVGVYITNEDDWPGIVKDIAKCQPDYLCVWNRSEKWGATIYLVPTLDDVAKPVTYWKHDLDFLPWLDFQNNDFATGKRYGTEALKGEYACT
jgi:hypothetical protein